MRILNLDNFDENDLGYSLVVLVRYIRSDVVVSLLRLAPAALLLLISHDLLAFYNPNRWFNGWQRWALWPEFAFWLLILGVPTLLLMADFLPPLIDRWRTFYEVAGREELPDIRRERNSLQRSLDYIRQELTKTEDKLKAEIINSERTLDRLTSARKELDKTRTRAARAEAELQNTTRLLEETKAKLIKAEQLNLSVETRKNQEILSALKEADAQLQDRMRQVGEKAQNSAGQVPGTQNEKTTKAQPSSTPSSTRPVQTAFSVNEGENPETGLSKPKKDQSPPSAGNPKDIFL